ncbi:MAG TPA: ferrous iron transport protein A [Firmicutes bacterium]|nr:ferrous iron transport protein A [Bacillota bacterium]
MEYLSLTHLRPGEKGRVARIAAGAYATKRLYEMGFNSGASVQVVKNDLGPLVVLLSGNKIALGRGLAEKMVISKQRK